MIDFKLFEENLEKSTQPEFMQEPQGLLRKSAAVKRWENIGVGKSGDSVGVFALDDIKDNETIEECHVILVPIDEVKGGVIIDYMFKIDNSLYALALGNGSIYNHRNQPNARWEYDDKKQLVRFVAVRAIKSGEEIYISYGKDYFATRKQNMKS
jgi:SET domain-containing protein